LRNWLGSQRSPGKAPLRRLAAHSKALRAVVRVKISFFFYFFATILFTSGRFPVSLFVLLNQLPVHLMRTKSLALSLLSAAAITLFFAPLHAETIYVSYHNNSSVNKAIHWQHFDGSSWQPNPIGADIVPSAANSGPYTRNAGWRVRCFYGDPHTTPTIPMYMDDGTTEWVIPSGGGTSPTFRVLPIVSIYALEWTTIEGSFFPAIFRIQRTGSTSSSLSVETIIGGTATFSPSFDFSFVANGGSQIDPVAITAGNSYVDAYVWSYGDGYAEPLGETVILTIDTSSSYSIGSPSSDVVEIVEE
jgi:hypothetical protein